MASKEEIAWAAGLFEGEGCLTILHARYKDRVTPYPRIQMSNTDKDLLIRFSEVMRGGSIYSKKTGALSKKPQWMWQIADKAGVKQAIETLYPWLSVKRQIRAKELLALC